MNDKLMNRARELLALRDKATPGPWASSGCRPAGTVHGGNGDWFVANCGGSANAQCTSNARFIASAHDMADTIRDLMAEVERLKDRVEHSNDCARRAIVDCEAAEARLRELASAEPVLWTDEAEECVEYTPREWASVALIRRPEMPS